jgi:hypothetical protein
MISAVQHLAPSEGRLFIYCLSNAPNLRCLAEWSTSEFLLTKTARRVARSNPALFPSFCCVFNKRATARITMNSLTVTISLRDDGVVQLVKWVTTTDYGTINNQPSEPLRL